MRSAACFLVKELAPLLGVPAVSGFLTAAFWPALGSAVVLFWAAAAPAEAMAAAAKATVMKRMVFSPLWWPTGRLGHAPSFLVRRSVRAPNDGRQREGGSPWPLDLDHD